MPINYNRTISKKQISLIHIAKVQLELTEVDYREILKVGGSNSSKTLDQFGFELVMQVMIAKGFKSSFNKSFYGYRDGMASPPQLILIRELWLEYTHGEGTEATLGKWLENSFKISSMRFLTIQHATKAITALKKMKYRNQKLNLK